MVDPLLGKTALVTGASSGIGAAVARDLARRGVNLVLVARRADRLEALAAETRLFGVTAEAAPTDLADPASRANLAERFGHIDLLVNNAGFGMFGKFIEADWTRLDRMLNVNIAALTDLTHLFARKMAERGGGRIMLVASIFAFHPVPLYAAYAASKAYVLSLGTALDAELAPSGVRVSVLCPGGTETEFFEVADQTRAMSARHSRMEAAEVARAGNDGLAGGQTIMVPGILNAAMAFGTRFSPRSLATKIAYRVMKR